MFFPRGNSNAMILPEKLNSLNKGKKQSKVKYIGERGKVKQVLLSILLISLKVTWACLLRHPHSLTKVQTRPKGFHSLTDLSGDCQSMKSVDSAISLCITAYIGAHCSQVDSAQLSWRKKTLWPSQNTGCYLKDSLVMLAPWQHWYHGNGDRVSNFVIYTALIQPHGSFTSCCKFLRDLLFHICLNACTDLQLP